MMQDCLKKIISNMVQTDARFTMFILQNPLEEVVSFFQTLFHRIIEKWHRIYPDNYLEETLTEAQTQNLNSIVREIETEYMESIHPSFIHFFFVETLRLYRKNLSSSLYKRLLLSSLADERSTRLVHHQDSDKIAVILDPRYDDLMEAVIRNFMHFLNKSGWNLMIFSAAVHKKRILTDFPTCLFAPIDEKWMIRDDNGKPTANMTANAYNDILLSKEFWESIPSTHIAIFQKDCVMYRMFDEHLFLSYDFAGANFFNLAGSTAFHGGMNGGFSLRNRQAMIECVQSVSWDTIIQYNTQLWSFLASIRPTSMPMYYPYIGNEDAFFTNACEILNKRMPDVILRNRLSIEAFKPSPFIEPAVYHGWNKNYHDIDTAKSLLVRSPFFMKYVSD